MDPESAHQQLIQTMAWLEQNCDRPPVTWLQHQWSQSYCLSDPRLNQTLWGLEFPNPVGLAAGFDKDGVATHLWPNFGFGFTEVGTVTHHPQPGNPRPRLFRLPRDQAAINRMGFNNQGAAKMAEVLRRSQRKINPAGQLPLGCCASPPLGINLGKSKITPLEDAAADYLESFRLLKPYGDYFVINVSSPNTPGLRSLQATAQLEPILAALQAENLDRKPLLIKISPDLAWEDIGAIVSLAQPYDLAGIIATNTTIQRQGLQTGTVTATGHAVTAEAGGLSGAPLRQRSTEIIRYIWNQTQGQLPIIGVGGIFTATDAWEKLTAGASLVQIYTGWLYEGPGLVRQILTGLLQRLEETGLTHLAEAVGLQHRA
jgi:dihydroorotate dehydrogenase